MPAANAFGLIALPVAVPVCLAATVVQLSVYIALSATGFHDVRVFNLTHYCLP